jgi:hypothetical protein
MLSYFTSSIVSWAFLHFSFFYFTFFICVDVYTSFIILSIFIYFFNYFSFVLMCASFILYVFSMQMLEFLFSLRFFMAQVFVQLQPWTRFDIYKVILLLFLFFCICALFCSICFNLFCIYMLLFFTIYTPLDVRVMKIMCCYF